jgi:hypothetical protein
LHVKSGPSGPLKQAINDGCVPVLQINDWCGEPFTGRSSSSTSSSCCCSTCGCEKPLLQLEVSPGQLDIGRRLVQVIYSSSPDLSDMTPKQLLQLAGVADKYMVGKALAAAGEALGQVDWEHLSCEEAAAVFEVPASENTLADHQQVVGDARAAAVKRLVALVGDLEVVWSKTDSSGGDSGSGSDGSSSQQLLALPGEALLYLLKQRLIKASSEDTVFDTVTEWIAAHPDTPEALQRCLAQALQLANCSPTYFTAVVCRKSSWLMKLGFLTQEDIACASTLCSMPQQQREVWASRQLAPAYLMGTTRPPSQVTRLAWEWDVPVILEQAGLLDLGPEHIHVLPDAPAPVWWQGRRFQVAVGLSSKVLEVYLTSHAAPAVCDIQCDLFGLPVDKPALGLKVAPKSGSLGATQLLGLQDGCRVTLVSCFMAQPCGHRPSAWWCSLQGKWLVAAYQYTHVRVCVEVTAIH